MIPPSAGGKAPLTVRSSASATDPSGKIVEYVWTYGDGTFPYNPRSETRNYRDTLSILKSTDSVSPSGFGDWSV